MSQKELELEIKTYPKQGEFVDCKDFKSLFIAGVGAGKTVAGALKSLLFVLDNPGAKGIVTAPTYSILNEATIPCYREYFPDWLIDRFITHPHPRLYLTNGSYIQFWSTTRPELIAGITAAFAHMDEGSMSPFQAFINTRQRLRQQKNGKAYPFQIWVTTTPRQLNWLYHEVKDEKDPITKFQATTRDNTFLDDVEGYILRQGIKVGSKEYEQEILGEFVSLAGECLFGDETLERCLNDCEQPIERRKFIDIFREPVVGAKYVAGADCADEGGGGVNSLIISDAQTGVEMAEINADISADKFADMINELCTEYRFPLLGVERNGVGNAVIMKLKMLGYPNQYIDDKGKEGWFTSTNAILPKVSRHTMLVQYEEAVRNRSSIPASSDAIGEMSTFVRNDKGIYEKRQGCKDDRVIARAIAWQMTKHRLHPRSGFIATKRLATSYV